MICYLMLLILNYKHIKIIDTQLINKIISKDFTIKLDNGEDIIINKWKEEAPDGSDDSEWCFITGSVHYNALPKEEQEKFTDLIREIKL